MNSSAQGPVPANAFKDLIRQVESLRLSIEEKADSGRALLQDLPPDRYPSAQNLLHYLAMRSQDIRPLQDSWLAWECLPWAVQKAMSWRPSARYCITCNR